MFDYSIGRFIVWSLLIYATPSLDDDAREKLGALDEARRRLGREVALARPWTGTLRRQARAATARSSTAIEGFHVSAEAALEIVDHGTVGDDPDRQAVAGYAFAMEHVAALSDDPWFGWVDRLILDLHFEACSSQRATRPGRWRTGPVYVTSPRSSRAGDGIAYRGPDAAEVPRLVGETLTWLAEGDLDAHVVVRAAMAHLHLVSIHPFQDGNGRISRIVQALERCLSGGTERAAYAAEAGVSPATASADLRRLLDAGLVERKGTTRDARYVPSAMLLAQIDAG